MIDFTDGRSRRVVFVTHCHLNQNARANGAAESPASTRVLLEGLLARELGVVQMPCPELAVLGLDRGHLRIRSSLESIPVRKAFRKMARDLVFQIRQYASCGVTVLGILGKNGSPACGVEKTSRSDGKGSIPGSGVFLQVLQEELQREGLDTPVVGTVDGKQAAALAVVDGWLQRNV